MRPQRTITPAQAKAPAVLRSAMKAPGEGFNDLCAGLGEVRHALYLLLLAFQEAKHDRTPCNTRKACKNPGPDHPITIERNLNRVVVKAAGRVIASTNLALTLKEATYPPVYYIPRGDADMTLLARTDQTTHCPYKGDANYFSIPSGGERSVNAVWTYEDPHPAVSAIKDHLAFYPSRVDLIEEQHAE